MADERLLLSEKYKAFLRCDAPVEFLEGTTAAGKTTVGIFKFMLKVAESEKKLHILSGLDLGTIEKNIINKDLGILDDFGPLVEYNASGRGKNSLPHLLFHTSTGDKIIYVLGYDNKTRWKKGLGGQYGCLYIDEINIADMEYVREASMRCDYLMGTLNPDDPNLPIYQEYINCSRPLPEWVSETPNEITELLTEEPKPNWVHWFFSFVHNLGLSRAKIDQIKLNTPRGTKLWKNKIEGLRGRATGLIFSNFIRTKHVIDKAKAKTMNFVWFSAGLDTAYSESSPDTLAMIYIGITDKGQVVVLDEEVYNNANLDIPLAPSDMVERFNAFLERNRSEWGFARDVFIDNADQATITELKKYKRQHGSLYNFNNAYKKITIIDRIHLQLGWIGKGCYLVLKHCKHHIRELESYSWKEDKYEPEDRNDHTINACQYAWIPFKIKIGIGE
ncbi:MAG: terminase [Eubacterium sp.]